MKSIRLMVAALALVATTSFAASSVSLDTSGLTEAQIAELKIQALKLQQQQKGDATPAVTTVTQGAQQVSTAALQEAEKWTNFGKNLGSKVLNLVKKPGITSREVTEFTRFDSAYVQKTLDSLLRRVAAKDSVALPPVPEVLR